MGFYLIDEYICICFVIVLGSPLLYIHRIAIDVFIMFIEFYFFLVFQSENMGLNLSMDIDRTFCAI